MQEEITIIEKEAAKREEKIIRYLSDLENDIEGLKKRIQDPKMRHAGLDTLVNGHPSRTLAEISALAGEYKGLIDVLEFLRSR